MNDETKELLTLAAKAMGFEVQGWFDDGQTFAANISPDQCTVILWNPLKWDSDLVDMECQLEISHSLLGRVTALSLQCPRVWVVEYSDYPSVREARTWASVLLAAEIGRRME